MTGKWAIILCGGRGSRLGSITESIPKPLVEVHGKPIIWYSFFSLYKHGFRNFIFPLGYKVSMLWEYIENTFAREDCKIFCVDTGEDTLIANRLAQVIDIVPNDEDFFLINSDTLFDFDIDAMYEQHKREKALVTLASAEVISPWGVVQMYGDKMIGFDRDRKIRHIATDGDTMLTGRIFSGLCFINKSALQYVDLTVHINFENELFRAVINAGKASHFDLQGMWFPIDTPKDLDIVNMKVPDINGVGEGAKIVKESLGGVADGLFD